ncbi:hypothetical protein LCGC14_2790510, partial [marine sediment metagenome]
MLAEKVSDLSRGGAVPVDAQRQRLQTFQHDPGIERAHGGTGMLDVGVQRLLDERAVTEYEAAETAPLAVDMLGGRIDHDVG